MLTFKKDVRSLYTIKYIIFTGITKFINHILYIYVFQTLFYTLSYVKENIGILLLLDIEKRNTTYVFAYKVIEYVYLNSSLH